MTWPTDRPGDEVRELAIELALPLDVAERVLAYGKQERRAGYDTALTEVEQGVALPITICNRIDAAVQAERVRGISDMREAVESIRCDRETFNPVPAVAHFEGLAWAKARMGHKLDELANATTDDALDAALAQAEQRGGEIVKARFIAETRKHMEGLLAQARQETWEKAAVIAETLRDGNPSAIAGTAWWGTKIAAAIRLAAAQEGGKS